MFEQHGRTITGQFINVGGDGLSRQRWIQFLQRRPQSPGEHHLAFGFPPEQASLINPVPPFLSLWERTEVRSAAAPHSSPDLQTVA